MLEPEALQAALFAAAGEVQALINHLGSAARSAGVAKLVFGPDLLSSFRRALQFGRTEVVSMDLPLASSGLLAQPSDVVVAARSRVPQLAVELRWHPRGEDHAGFATAVIGDVAKMALARTSNAVEQAAVLVSAPARFWRWLPTYSQDHRGFDLLSPEADQPASTKADFLAGPAWDSLFASGLPNEVPERLWTSPIASADVRSPWIETELRLLDVKGIGRQVAVREQ